MQRHCDHCGRPYEARRSTSKFCGSSCRGKASLALKVSPLPVVPSPNGDGPCARAARVALESVDRLETPSGAAAMGLAAVLDEGSPSGTAAVAKEYRAAMDAALAGVAAEADLVDELRARREQRFRGA